MTIRLAGKWEEDDGGFRRYCDVTNRVEQLRVSNFNEAWRTDGSEIGRETSFTPRADPGYFGAGFKGSIRSGMLECVIPNPPTIAGERFYPTANVNDDGWRYDAVDPGLPKSLALPDDMNAGYPSDVHIAIAAITASKMRATIVSMTFDKRWNTLWLDEEIGDGRALEAWLPDPTPGNHGKRQDAFSFATYYFASWRSAHFQPDGSQVSGIAGFVFDCSLAVGTYALSSLISAGRAKTTEGYSLLPGYLHVIGNAGNQPHYEIR